MFLACDSNWWRMPSTWTERSNSTKHSYATCVKGGLGREISQEHIHFSCLDLLSCVEIMTNDLPLFSEHFWKLEWEIEESTYFYSLPHALSQPLTHESYHPWTLITIGIAGHTRSHWRQICEWSCTSFFRSIALSASEHVQRKLAHTGSCESALVQARIISLHMINLMVLEV